ncbi:hypothetical protein NCHU2750_40100 [Neorhizobium sp. NCHU2750]|nr:hypothetical protein NCHU2750_40100 [Neorhizobium sp. NCHU2750]
MKRKDIADHTTSTVAVGCNKKGHRTGRLAPTCNVTRGVSGQTKIR